MYRGRADVLLQSNMKRKPEKKLRKVKIKHDITDDTTSMTYPAHLIGEIINDKNGPLAHVRMDKGGIIYVERESILYLR